MYRLGKNERHFVRTYLPFFLVGVAVLIIGLFAWRPWKGADPSKIPSSVLSQLTTFTPYQALVLPAGLHIDDKGYSTDAGLLIFRLTNGTQSVTVTEQASPAGLADQQYPAAEKVDGVDGKAYLNRDKTRTFGTLFAKGKDDKPTMILINTSDPFTTDELKDLLRSFRAVQ